MIHSSKAPVLYQTPAVRQRGFTLIELMITVAIVAIIASIAYPAYTESTQKSKRADAKAHLMQLAQQLERCMSLYGSYDNASCNIQNGNSYVSEKGYYSAAVTSATTTFSIVGQPPATSSQFADTSCRSFTITHLGVKTSTKADGSAATDCW